MLTNGKTEERIVNLMKKGAKLVFRGFIYYDGDPMRILTQIALQHNGSEIILSHVTETWIDSEGSEHTSVSNPAAYAIIKREDIVRGYPGYQSDYSDTWREVYEHRDLPAPRWVTEQWDNPVQRFESGYIGDGFSHDYDYDHPVHGNSYDNAVQSGAIVEAVVAPEQEKAVTVEEVKKDDFIITEFLLILQWWASEYPDMPLTSTQVWEMYRQGVRVGKVWDEVLEDLKLPEMLNW